MELTFGLFVDMADAQKAALDLLRRGFEEGEINLLVRHQIVQGPSPEKHGRIGADTAIGRVLSGGKQVVLGRDGTLLCAGRNATALLNAAVDAGHDSLISMLEQFLAPAHAAAYADGVREGGVLVWVDVARGGVHDAEGALHSGRGVSVTTVNVPDRFDFR
jgi:hypothetical protein